MVTNLKGATIKFGDPLAAPAHNFIKYEAEEEIFRRESMNPALYPYVTTDREKKMVKGSLGWERVSNLKAATASLGGVAIGHNFTKFEITDSPMFRDSLHATNYPYTTFNLEGKRAEGSAEFELIDSVDYPDIDIDSVVLAIAGTGFTLSGNMELNNLKVSAASELGSKATISFNFKTKDGDYTWTLTTGGYPSIHAVSIPMELSGTGLWLFGNVRVLSQKFSASAELGSKATIDMEYETVDGNYEYAKADVA
jgi:hypothetical protein